MESNNSRWLQHLINAVPQAGFGKKLSMYTIALEGWRRGLKLKFFTIDDPENKLRIRYSLSYKGKEHRFESSKGDKTTDLAYEICDNKFLTKEYLQKAGVPVAEGKRFTSEESDEKIIQFANSLGFPLVLKPINANGGKGVFSNINSMDSFKEALYHVREILGYQDIIVETYIPGNEYRVVVVNGKVVGALNRIPANVIGNGKDNIRDLIKNKNRERKKNPHLKSRVIKVDTTVIELLKSYGYSLTTVPKDGEVVPLRLTSNLSTGGDSVDLTDVLPDNLKKIAIDATEAIPGLTVSGMDMIVDSVSKKGVIIEANTRPGLGGHLFPADGIARDIPKEIIDFYFPETKNVEKSCLFFDFNSILDPLQKRTAKVVEVTDLPKGELYGKKFIVTGKVQNVGYLAWIKRQALSRRMHGFAENLSNGDVVIVVAGMNQQEIDDFKEVCLQGNDKSEVTGVNEQHWDYPVKIGFEINRELTRNEIQELEEEKKQVEKERDFYKKRYGQIKSSRMWRTLSPLRHVLDFFKHTIRTLKRT